MDEQKQAQEISEEAKERIQDGAAEDQAAPQEASLEDLFAELEGILAAMDDREVSLEDSFALYEKGMKTVRRCYDKLDLVEKKMRQIAQDGSEVPLEE